MLISAETLKKKKQTDLNSLNLGEEKYENKAVLIAFYNHLHFFFCDNNCDNHHMLWAFFWCQAVCFKYQQAGKMGIVLGLQMKKVKPCEVQKTYFCVES